MAEQQPSQASVERTWGMLCHLIAFAWFVVPFVGNIVGPLIVWQIRRQEFEFVDDQGKESLNFQITVTIAGIITGVLVFVFLGIPLAIALGVFDIAMGSSVSLTAVACALAIALGVFYIVMVIIATTRANNGERYRYPVNWRIIK